MKLMLPVRIHVVVVLWICVALGCGSDSGLRNICGKAGAPMSCGDTCAIDANCGQGTFCREGECVAECMVGDTRCGSGKECDVTGRCHDNDGGVCDLPVAPAACGRTCTDNTQCDLGTHCQAGTCFAECIVGDTRCDADYLCSDRGECVFDNSGCIDEVVHPSRVIPNVMFLVDRSGSMAGEVSAGVSRWDAVRTAILSVVDASESIVRFGYTTYAGDVPGFTCPALETLPVAINNFSAIESAFSLQEPLSGTPTGESIHALVSYLNDNQSPGGEPTVIMLATDGNPDTCANSSETNAARDLSIAEATAAFADSDGVGTADISYKLFILSVASGVSLNHLKEMANVGVGKPKTETADPAPYWTASNTAGLAAAFQEVVRNEISCDVPLNGSVEDLDRVCEGEVTLDGTPLVCGTDWQLKPESLDTLRLLGDACEDWKTAGDPDELSATFPCGVISPG